MQSTEVAILSDLLDRLRSVDTNFRIFGSKEHRYHLGPILSDAELSIFESSNRIQLPNDYRQFLSTIGNGGAGPFYGLASLNTFGRDLSRPFPFLSATNEYTDENLEQLLDHNDCSGIKERCVVRCWRRLEDTPSKGPPYFVFRSV